MYDVRVMAFGADIFTAMLSSSGTPSAQFDDFRREALADGARVLADGPCRGFKRTATSMNPRLLDQKMTRVSQAYAEREKGAHST
jgi:hypothetical protein